MSVTVSRRFVVAAGVLLPPTLYTAAILVAPDWRLTWLSAEARLIISTFGTCAALLAALTLRLPEGETHDASRNALVAALVAMAAVQAFMLIGFMLIRRDLRTDVLAFNGWLAARYLAGIFFIVAALGVPRARVRSLIAGMAIVLVVVLTTSWSFVDQLPRPLVRGADGLAVVHRTLAAHVFITGLPTLLFLLGAVLAWRLYRDRSDATYGWLTLALAMQVLSKVHELVYSASFGPLITTSDVLLIGMQCLLVVGALVCVRSLSEQRALAIETQSSDMRTLTNTLTEVTRFTESERLFRSVVSHELSTPIAAIRAYAHVLANPKTPQHQADKASGAITAESARLQTLVERMQRLSDLESDRFNAESRTVRLRPLLEEAAGFGNAVTTQHEVVVRCEDVCVRADPVLLGQALRNLIMNAAKYSPAHTTITLTARRRGDRGVGVGVADQGPGIRSADRERIMEKYTRGATTSTVPGSGLGLYIVRRIAEAHGAALDIADAPGGGTYVELTLKEVP